MSLKSEYIKPLVLILAHLVCLIVTSLLFTSCSKIAKPNVLFILSDDQGWGDMSSHGNRFIETPTLDRLCKEGLEFDRFFVSPLCAPTRASLLTGRYHLKTGVTSVSNGLEIMNAEETTLAELFKANGYATGIFGKWHNGAHVPHRPENQGFDEFIGFCSGHLTNYFNSTLDSLQHEIKSSGYITDFLADKAIDFIQRHRRQPFFCYVPFNAPHSPFQVPNDYFDKYKAKGLDDTLASVYGMVENMDDNISRILKELDRSGLVQNTIVIFMSDNGPNGVRYNGHMKGIKGQVDEGGVRVPCMIRWPGKIKPGRKYTGIAAHLDWYPTLSSLCKLAAVPGKPIDGLDFSSRMLGLDSSIEVRSIFTHVASLDKILKNKPGAMRTPQYRIVFKSDRPEYYDMVNDPGQMHDLYPDDSIRIKNDIGEYYTWFKNSSQLYQPIKPTNINTAYTELPTCEAIFKGNLKYIEGHGWAHDWLTDWSSTADEMSWLITSDQEISADVFIKYTCSAKDTGSMIQVEIAGQSIRNKMTQAFDPPLISSPDRVKRKEAYEKEWALLRIGRIAISKGEQVIKLKASDVIGKHVGDVNSMVVKKME